MTDRIKLGVGIGLIVLASLVVAGWMQAAEWKGVSRTLEAQADTIGQTVDSLDAIVVMMVDEAVRQDDEFNSREGEHIAKVAVLEERVRSQARAAREAALVTATLVEELPPEMQAIVQPILDSYEDQLAVKDEIIATITEERDEERERKEEAISLADTWESTAFTLGEERDALKIQVGALEGALNASNRAQNPSLGLRLKADWWIGVGGGVIGFLIGSRGGGG